MNDRILKGTDGDGEQRAQGSGRVLKAQVHAAREEGREVVRRAEEQAEAILAEARAEAERLRAEAKAAGYEDGITALNRIALDFQDRAARLLEESRGELIRLALLVARKVLGRELEENPGALTDLVVQTVRRIRHEKRIQIRVAAGELEKIRAGHPRLLEEIGAGREIEFREDPTIKEGGAIVETDLGIIDARLEVQLKVLERALLTRRTQGS